MTSSKAAGEGREHGTRSRGELAVGSVLCLSSFTFAMAGRPEEKKQRPSGSLKGDVCFFLQLLHLLPGGTEARDKLEAHQSREPPLTATHSKKRDVFSSPVGKILRDFSSNAEAGNKPKSVLGSFSSLTEFLFILKINQLRDEQLSGKSFKT